MSARDDAAILRLLNLRGVPHVVIGGWAVIAHGHVRATRDIDVLIPDRPDVHERLASALHEIKAVTLSGARVAPGDLPPPQGWQVATDHGRLDVLLEGDPPLDFASVSEAATEAELSGEKVLIADLAHLVAFKRLAGRPQDRLDLVELEKLNGSLPMLAVPGLDPGA